MTAASPAAQRSARADGAILREIVPHMPQITSDRIQAMALENARRNLPYVRRGASLRDLRSLEFGEGDSAVVIAAGPSARRNNPAAALKAANYRGTVVATESALFQCLNAGLVPSLVVCVDPHPQRIVRWFGDPNLAAEIEEDYFRRQDLDASFANEHEHNKKVLALMDRYGKGLRIALASCAAQDVVERVHDIGMEVFWWNPMIDDPDLPTSATRGLCRENGLPAMNAGGNVGTSAWMLAHAVLGKRHVALTGIDFGYYGDTPYERTQYYKEALALVGPDRLDEMYIDIYNPFTESWFFADPAYYWYRQAFLELAPDAECTTYNCTGGGTLFGDGIVFTELNDFLRRVAG